MAKDTRLILRTERALKSRIVELAQREHAGNISKAARRILDLGLRAVDDGQREQAQKNAA